MRQLSLRHPTDFESWRTQARALAIERVPANDVQWSVESEEASEPSLFAPALHEPVAADEFALAAPATPMFTVPRAFMTIAQVAVQNRDPGRFGLLYSVLLRLREEPRLLELEVDPDIARLNQLAKAVTRDQHRMKAFVRFRKIETAEGAHFIAWYEPEQYIVESTAPFFERRYAGQRWSILTPVGCAAWDGKELSFGPGVTRDAAPDDDTLEDLWRTYYASIFNPARLNPSLMRQHLPRKFWHNLPEAESISQLVATAPERTAEMIEREAAQPRRQRKSSASAPISISSIPSGDLDTARQQVQDCRACDLWRNATQAVFGEGSATARVMLVGEQPGDQEDVAGKPFVGPAGKLLDRALAEAGIDRSKVYVTNAVKHFSFELRGKRRIHKKPNEVEIDACNRWLEHEIDSIAPPLIIAMGATAIRAVFGKAMPVKANRGRLIELNPKTHVLVTVHPSYLLRIPPEDQDTEFAAFVDDLKLAAKTERDLPR